MATSSACSSGSPGGEPPPRPWKFRRGSGGEGGGGGSGDDRQEAMISLSALECGVCLSLVCQPVSLSCGHCFCRVCLINTLRRNKKKCPTCRAVCHNSAEDQPEDVMIANIARTCFPELSERRRREVEQDINTWDTVLPIFYYNVPMFPGETLNLHLFEPRYRLMIQRIVNTSRRFAYVPNYTDYTAAVGDVALVAEMRECEFLADGRVLLDAKLVSRQTVADHFVEEGTQGLHFCRLEPRIDDPPADDRATVELEELHQRTRGMANQIMAPVRAQIVNRYGPMPSGAEPLSLWISSVLPMSVRERHALLAGTSTVERLQVCERNLISLGGNAPPPPPSRVPAAVVAEAYEAYEAARHLGGDEAAAAAAAAAASAAAAGVAAGGEGDGSDEEEGAGAGAGVIEERLQDAEMMAAAQAGPAVLERDPETAEMVAAHARALSEARAAIDAAGGGASGAGAGARSAGARAEQEGSARETEPAAAAVAVVSSRTGSEQEPSQEQDRPEAMSMSDEGTDINETPAEACAAPSTEVAASTLAGSSGASTVSVRVTRSGSGAGLAAGSVEARASFAEAMAAPPSDAQLPPARLSASSTIPSPRSMAARGDGGTSAPVSSGEMKGADEMKGGDDVSSRAGSSTSRGEGEIE